MTRLVLSFSISCALLVMVLLTARTQSRNHAIAADLDEMMMERHWYASRAGEIRETLERFEFGLRLAENHGVFADDDHLRENTRGEE